MTKVGEVFVHGNMNENFTLSGLLFTVIFPEGSRTQHHIEVG
jgi:hypothetical protein